MLTAGEESTPYTNLTVAQRKSRSRKVREKVLDKAILILAGSEDIVDQEAMVHSRLRKLHKGFKPYS